MLLSESDNGQVTTTLSFYWTLCVLHGCEEEQEYGIVLRCSGRGEMRNYSAERLEGDAVFVEMLPP